MPTLTEEGANIYKFLVNKNKKKSKTNFWTSKYLDYSFLGEPTIDNFIEIVSFSIAGVYIEGGYHLKLYYPGGKLRSTESSDWVFTTKEDCVKSLGPDFIKIWKNKRKQHYENLIALHKQKIQNSEFEIIKCKNILNLI